MNRWLQNLVMIVVWCCCATMFAAGPRVSRPVYHSPLHPEFSPDGRHLAVTDATAGSLVVMDVATGRVVRTVEIGGRPAGAVWSRDGRSVYVADTTGGEVVACPLGGERGNTSKRAAGPAKLRRHPVGPRPVGLAWAAKKQRLVVANSADGSITIVDLTGQSPPRRKAAGPVPYMLAVTPDESTAVVGNRLPVGDASKPTASASVTLVDLDSDDPPIHVGLPPNSTNVHGVAIGPDGRWAYVVHNLARAMLPTEQIEFGWINANAMTVVDLRKRRRYATILLDRYNQGAANPFGAVVSPDDRALWVTLSGVHQIGKVDLVQLHKLLGEEKTVVEPKEKQPAQGEPELNTARGSMQYSATWQLGIKDPNSVELVVSVLPAEYGHGHYLPKVFYRVDLPGNGPRGLAISPDGRLLAVAMYYSGTVVLVDTVTMKILRGVPIAPQPVADAVRRGEMIFHDATYCFEHWLSCATCHPDGRADGLNWDLMNDGIGNPKNTRSMLWAHQTPPMMSRGVRTNMPGAAAAGFKFLLFQEPQPEEFRAVEAYLSSLVPEASPRLVGGRLSEKARRGQAIFESPRVGCARCHPAPLYTDLKMHDVGTQAESDEAGPFDTPTLIELWRTAPYLHHGQAATLREVITKMNRGDRHGHTSRLSGGEIDALVEYLQSL
ncbi:MAG: SMP-30/gluconolactonase/LRE family protein [Planctomycetes bacterium]|nr:SMP-30/gluconolactonase/LRE family protein [Planctomycetota bacterium]